jgi:hypothetical protein
MSATTILLILLFAFAMVAMHRGGHRHGGGHSSRGEDGYHGGGGHAHRHTTDDTIRGTETGSPPASPSADRDDEHKHAAHGAA